MLLAVGILAWVGYRLAVEWAANPAPALRFAPVDLTLAFLAAGGGLIGLALLFAATLRLIGHGDRRSLPYILRIWIQGYFYRYIPGKVMLVVERARLGEAIGIPRATSVVLVLWETLLLLAGATVLATIGLAVVPAAGNLPSWAIPVGAVGALALLLAFPFSLRLPFLRARLPPELVRLPLRAQLPLVLGYAGVWLLLGASFAFTCRCFEGGEGIGLEIALWYVLSYVAGLVLSVTPAGLGVREGLLVAGLAGRVPAPAALAFALASRALMTAVEALLVGLATRIPPPPPLGEVEGG